MSEDSPYEVILRVGGEGGSLAILGQRLPDGNWRFLRERDESVHAGLLSEEDQEGLSFHERDGAAETFPEALKLLGEYPWHRLYPLEVHSEFRQSAFDAVMELAGPDGGRNLEHWKRACGRPSD